MASNRSERTVPAGAIATAMAIVESLHDRDGDRDQAEVVAELTAAVDRWGKETIVEAFGLLIYTMMNMVKAEPGSNDALHLLVPAVLTRLHRMQMPEVPDEALPTVAGLLTAAFFGQGPYEWRTSLGALPSAEGLVWGYTAWLLVDFIDNAVLGEQPGRFAQVLAQALGLDEPEDDDGHRS